MKTLGSMRSSRAERLSILKSLMAVSNVAGFSLYPPLNKIIEPCLAVFKRINPLRLGSSGQLETRLQEQTAWRAYCHS